MDGHPLQGAAFAATGEPGDSPAAGVARGERDRPCAPFGRRLCEVVENRASGGYRLFSLLDREGPAPAPGQFYMLATESGWEGGGGRPLLPRAFSVAETGEASGDLRLDFLAEAIGPGTQRLCGLEAGEGVWVNGPLGNGFSPPRELAAGAAGAILVGGGIGVAPLALLRRSLAERGVPTRVLLGFRDEEHSGGLDDLFRCCEVGLASDDGHIGHGGPVTELLAAMLAGDDAASAAVYACGPPPMLDAVAAMCAERGAPCELAMEAPMACGYGACFGCAVPKPDGGYLRLCVDGPVVNASQLPGTEEPRAAGPVAAGEARGASRPDNRRSNETGDLSIRPSERHPAPPLERSADAGTATREGECGGVRPRSGVLFSAPQGEQLGASSPGGKPSKRTDAPTLPPSAAVEFCGLELRHPVVNGSGTFDAIAARRVYGEELIERFPFAAFVSKTITPAPRAGNEPQRIWETPSGMINSIGLPNKGLDGFLVEDLPRLGELPVPLIVSVMGTSREEFERLVAGVAEREEVAAVELNVSCPNVHSGLIVGEQPTETLALLRALRPLTSKPLIAKLTPNVADPASIAVAAEEGGADAVSLINTLKASAIDPASGRPAVAAGHGGLSGPAVRPVAVAQLREVAAAVGVPIVGMGGVSSGGEALEVMRAGAALVAVGTESFRDPAAGERIAAELSERLAARR